MAIKKISLEGFKGLSNIMECPYCESELTWKHVIGYGEYPLGGRRNLLNPNKTLGVGVECPNCFEKLCYHGDYALVDCINDYLLVFETK